MPGPELNAELQNHTATLTVIIGMLGGIVGVFIGAAATIVWRRIARVEDRQAELREKVIPELITRDDFNKGIDVLKGIGQTFIDRVESFMSACTEGKCFMAKMVQIYHHSMPAGNDLYPWPCRGKEGDLSCQNGRGSSEKASPPNDS